jgi:hypothetical protein
MYVGVIHRISDSEPWAAALRAGDLSIFPPEMHLVTMATSEQVDRAVCLWQAPSPDFVREALDRVFGAAASSECFAVPDAFSYLAAPQPASAGV